MTTKKLTAVPDVDWDIFNFDHSEHDHWLAINSLNALKKYYEDKPEMLWRLNSFASLIRQEMEK
jgi:hypothetical protein